MDYYDKTHYVAVVDKDDNILDRAEKWKAHEEGILHRAFTIGLKFEDLWIIQHRKHPVFDNVLDVSCSSHPVFTSEDSDENIDDITPFITDTLDREWDITGVSENDIKHKGSFYYKAQDPLSKYIEHEVCHFYEVQIDVTPKLVQDYAYGMSLIPQEKLLNKKSTFHKALAPWCVPILDLL